MGTINVVAQNTDPIERRGRTLIWRSLCVLLIMCAAWFAGSLPAAAVLGSTPTIKTVSIGTVPGHQSDLAELTVERDEDGLLLAAQLNFSLPSVVREALTWGVPMYFIAQADIVHPRWYWTNKQLGQARRYWRLSYLPLTRRWRLTSSSSPLPQEDISTGLAQHYNSLESALSALQHISSWRIAPADALLGSGQQTLLFSFKLDTSQLPRTLQIGLTTHTDWHLHIEQRLDLLQSENAP
jgi:hypothetical protein